VLIKGSLIDQFSLDFGQLASTLLQFFRHDSSRGAHPWCSATLQHADYLVNKKQILHVLLQQLEYESATASSNANMDAEHPSAG
jgi:hypothetical protein